MGLFDDLRCEIELPGAPEELRDFQTKSLGCTLASYTITAEGRLVEHTRRVVWLPMGELPHYDMHWLYHSHHVRHNPAKRMVRFAGPDVDTEYHGDVYFYAYYPGLRGEWYEFKARFTGGQLEWIRRVEEQVRLGCVSDDARV